MDSKPPTLRTLRQFAQRHPAFTEASLRWLRFQEASNGFQTAFVMVGRRVLIDEGRFFEIVAEQNGRSPEAA
ncbi:MAG: hypothetical protein IH936_09370 [Acidobacteria bacterium]|nr:hypothetical protein [Acidobacteriota bacterium]